MPPRSSPTARQQRLGSELRKLREQSGMSAQQAAALLGVDRTRIPHIESGRFGISAERVRTLAFNYGCPDTGLVDLLAAMAHERDRGWWEEHRGLLPPALIDIAELEYHASALHTAVTTHIPGLLQTEEHARAVFDTAVPPLPGPDLEARLALRLRRQEVLDRDRPVGYEAVIHEAALRMQFGGPKVAREQLERILAHSERDTVSIRVIPFAAGGFPGAGQSFTYVAAPVAQLDTVQLDSSHGSLLLDADMQLRRYRGLLDRLRGLALATDESRAFIRTIAQDL
ncbi:MULTISPECIES: helix-turn-helix domain-containing protein [Streptomyces]|uniref:DNA-binding protein n=1 Tax=Streptomyces venezuelae (strain ATCC 10712 / CBS 650.69 / DSM 40230 / JCM 4526 / NBRC 13096 / PD 04745) TaxID=953739 RepID=F2RF00_STRVP|nr:helix-turn-helix transcriptional regulator [Streptomyces venezuelae]APE25127.1 transcriptional regulator [Streptomyces venezuelae]QES02469.1 XRE family transcriptional regulator [Streptomyces venezuelae ATCC 10712]CCA59685.1 DNA-binding protein [Streptomyces venezuelae ATCC 10712]